MIVILAKSAGFCWGVRRAVEKARHLGGSAREPVYTDGPLIHNEQMMQQLEAEGIREIGDFAALRQGTLLIRAHGIPPQRRSLLEKLPVPLADATCPDVAKIQKQIEKHANRGCAVIIFGDEGHAEVVGLLGYAQGRGFVVGGADDVAKLPALDPVCLVAQSTQFPSDYAEIADAVRRRFPGAEVLDTICKSTKNRQQELIEMATGVDVIVVVGGAHSANTVRLVQLARSLRPTFHIQTSRQIDPDRFKSFRTAGLTAGASTPSFIIEEVQCALEAL